MATMAGPEPHQLGFDLDVEEPDEIETGASGRVVRVRPDVVGIDKCFDYVVEPGVEVEIGDLVRVPLAGRRIRGWVAALDVEPSDGHRLVELSKISGRGPTAELLELADWAAWRWSGRPAHFLRASSPDANVERLPFPARRTWGPARTSAPKGDYDAALAAALSTERAVLRWPPGADRYRIVKAALEATEDGWPLILTPSVRDAVNLARRLRTDGIGVALLAGGSGSAAAGEWARARAGAVVVGTRGAAWAPLPRVGRVVVLDEDDEAFQGDRAPTWHARDVVAERARRAGVPCVLVSATPSLEALAWGTVIDVGAGTRRAGWPRVQVVDQRELDPAVGTLFSPPLVDLVRGPGRILCVLNRTGRVRLLACAACRTVARCEVCGAAVSTTADATEDESFVCGRDSAHRRPALCLACGSTRFRNLRLGIGKAREELEALAGEPVGEVAAGAADPDPSIRILLGTEAVLHRFDRADGVAFLDLDQHLLAVRYRAAEQTLGLLARAARLASRGSGRLLIQTRSPEHPVVRAVVGRDPSLFTAHEAALRNGLRLPPAVALAVVSGPGAEAFVSALPRVGNLSVQGPRDGSWRIRADDHRVLCDALASTPRPGERVRIEVDPLNA